MIPPARPTSNSTSHSHVKFIGSRRWTWVLCRQHVELSPLLAAIQSIQRNILRAIDWKVSCPIRQSIQRNILRAMDWKVSCPMRRWGAMTFLLPRTFQMRWTWSCVVHPVLVSNRAPPLHSDDRGYIFNSIAFASRIYQSIDTQWGVSTLSEYVKLCRSIPFLFLGVAKMFAASTIHSTTGIKEWFRRVKLDATASEQEFLPHPMRYWCKATILWGTQNTLRSSCFALPSLSPLCKIKTKDAYESHSNVILIFVFTNRISGIHRIVSWPEHHHHQERTFFFWVAISFFYTHQQHFSSADKVSSVVWWPKYKLMNPRQQHQ